VREGLAEVLAGVEWLAVAGWMGREEIVRRGGRRRLGKLDISSPG
jgi:hypothetical protein